MDHVDSRSDSCTICFKDCKKKILCQTSKARNIKKSQTIKSREEGKKEGYEDIENGSGTNEIEEPCQSESSEKKESEIEKSGVDA